ncbi:MAG: hypothetical protein ACRD38_13030 [Nitrososphaerales archaeon]
MVEIDYAKWREDLKNAINESKVRITFNLPPKNPAEQKAEQSVVFLFGQIHDVIGFTDVQFNSHFPDCTALWNGQNVSIEFEFDVAEFNTDHKHKDKPENLIIICWENKWKSCPYPVIELKRLYT